MNLIQWLVAASTAALSLRAETILPGRIVGVSQSRGIKALADANQVLAINSVRDDILF